MNVNIPKVIVVDEEEYFNERYDTINVNRNSKLRNIGYNPSPDKTTLMPTDQYGTDYDKIVLPYDIQTNGSNDLPNSTPNSNAYIPNNDFEKWNPGDGYKYRGRGPLQITGHAMYRRIGNALKIDLENNPNQIADNVATGMRASAYFFSQVKSLNEIAESVNPNDEQSIVDVNYVITRRINGGTNGITQRLKNYLNALDTFGLLPQSIEQDSRLSPEAFIGCAKLKRIRQEEKEHKYSKPFESQFSSSQEKKKKSRKEKLKEEKTQNYLQNKSIIDNTLSNAESRESIIPNRAYDQDFIADKIAEDRINRALAVYNKKKK